MNRSERILSGICGLPAAGVRKPAILGANGSAAIEFSWCRRLGQTEDRAQQLAIRGMSDQKATLL
jgi:hypothetical protein